jgi:hypothetical protein
MGPRFLGLPRSRRSCRCRSCRRSATRRSKARFRSHSTTAIVNSTVAEQKLTMAAAAGTGQALGGVQIGGGAKIQGRENATHL